MSVLSPRTSFLIALAATFALAAPAAAQDADPIGALLDQAPAAPVVPPPVAPPPVSAPPPPQAYSPAPYAPAPPPVNHAPPPPPVVYAPLPPRTYSPPPPQPGRAELTAPVHVDETGRSPEAPPTSTDLNYEARMRSSFASAQGLQGPLDGAWTLRAQAGGELYALLLVDKGLGTLEGAWRDPRRRGSTDSSGFLAAVQRNGAQLSVSFYPRPGASAATITLNAGLDGVWTGELAEDGERRAVTLRRD